MAERKAMTSGLSLSDMGIGAGSTINEAAGVDTGSALVFAGLAVAREKAVAAKVEGGGIACCIGDGEGSMGAWERTGVMGEYGGWGGVRGGSPGRGGLS